MRPTRPLPAALLLLLPVALLASGRSVRGEDPDEPSWLRLEESDEAVALEIAHRTYRRAEEGAPLVRLVGVAHIADRSYFEELQRLLDAQDRVLYESVMPAGAGPLRTGSPAERVEDTQVRLRLLAGAVETLRAHGEEAPASLEALVGRARSLDARLGTFLAEALLDAWGRPVRYERDERGGYVLESLGADGAPGGEGEAGDLRVDDAAGVAALATLDPEGFQVQRELAVALGLVYQADGIDYDRPAWHVSDMDQDDLARAVAARGGRLDRVEQMLSGSGLSGAIARVLIGVLKLADRASGGATRVTLKILIASVLAREGVTEDLFAGRAAGADAALMAAIGADRNAVVVEDLRRVLAEEPAPRSVAIFYGAAHMRDLARRLADLGYAPVETTWHRAIGVDLVEAGVSPEHVRALRSSIERLLRSRD